MADMLHFLYGSVAGRVLLKGLAAPPLSKTCGRFLDSAVSGFLIAPFVKKNEIDLSDFETESIRSFNDCFSRKIRPGLRPIDMEPEHLIAPCDGLLSVCEIREDTVFHVKNSSYRLSDLLESRRLAARYQDGLCLVYRLCVNHYHRYCYVDSGKKSRNVFIKGELHTVRPVALEKMPVFVRNCREYTLLKTMNFGTVLQMEVGAMLVGRIVNYDQEADITRGQEKGMFQYGGSTIIVLLQKDRAAILPEFAGSLSSGEEIPVKMGQQVGRKLQPLPKQLEKIPYKT